MMFKMKTLGEGTMLKLLILLACSLALIGCDSRQPHGASNVGFVIEAPREAVVQQLEQMHATLLTNTPELLRAEVERPGTKKPMQVELAFRAGKLSTVTYIP